MSNITKCDKCDKNLTKKLPGLECRSCGKVVHANQTCSLLSTKQLAALRNTDSIDWTCDECQHNSPHRSSFIIPVDDEEEDEVLPSENSENRTIDAAKFMKEITAEMTKLLKKHLQPIENYLSVCCTKIDELVKTVEQQSKKIAELDMKYTQLQNQHVCIKLEINSLKQHVRTMEQQRLDKVLELTGLPKLPQEDLKNMSSKLSRIFNMNTTDIAYIKQIDGRNRQDCVMQIGLTQVEFTKSWVRAARKTSVFAENIVSGLPPDVAKSKVMLRYALTAANKSLLWNVQQKLRPTFYKYAWYQDGKVLVRKEDNTKPIVVKSEEDILSLTMQQREDNIDA